MDQTCGSTYRAPLKAHGFDQAGRCRDATTIRRNYRSVPSVGPLDRATSYDSSMDASQHLILVFQNKTVVHVRLEKK